MYTRAIVFCYLGLWIGLGFLPLVKLQQGQEVYWQFLFRWYSGLVHLGLLAGISMIQAIAIRRIKQALSGFGIFTALYFMVFAVYFFIQYQQGRLNEGAYMWAGPGIYVCFLSAAALLFFSIGNVLRR